MKVVLSLVGLAIVVIASFRCWKKQASLRPLFLTGLLLKICSGIFLGWIYLHYYTGDTFVYFEDGRTLTEFAYDHPGEYCRFLWNSDSPVYEALEFKQPRALFMVKVTSVVLLFIWDNYWFAAAFFSWISFLMLWWLVKTIRRHFPESTPAALFSFIFFPSVVFWSSGILKESILMCAICGLSVAFLNTWFRQRRIIVSALTALVCIWLLWNLKYYYAAVFIPLAVSALLTRQLVKSSRPFWVSFLVWMGIIVAMVLGISQLHPNFQSERFLSVLVDNYNSFQRYSSPGDAIVFQDLHPTWQSILVNSPLALVSGLLRPSIFDAGNIFQWVAAAENLIIFFLISTCIISNTRNNISKDPLLVISVLSFAVIMAVALALSSPNFGSLSRYRVGFLPFLIFILSYRNRFFDAVVTYCRKAFRIFVRQPQP